MTTSILCEYSRRDIDSILDGNFKEADSTSFWRELPRDHVPEGVPKNVRHRSRWSNKTTNCSFSSVWIERIAFGHSLEFSSFARVDERQHLFVTTDGNRLSNLQSHSDASRHWFGAVDSWSTSDCSLRRHTGWTSLEISSEEERREVCSSHLVATGREQSREISREKSHLGSGIRKREMINRKR